MSKPLAGIRVIELANFIAGPLCGTLLADMGADVVKVEPPGGDMSRATPPIRNGESVSFTALNRNKRSLVLDLKQPDAQEVMRKLAAKSDVFVEANRPGALEKMGLGAEHLKVVNPRIIYTSVSGFGQTGPDRRRAGVNLIIEAFSGVLSVTGAPGEMPMRPGVQTADVFGALFATYATLASLVGAGRTGEGRIADVSLVEASIAAAAWEAAEYLETGQVPQPMGNRHRLTAPYQLFETSDQRYVAIGTPNNILFQKFMQVIGLGTHLGVRVVSRFGGRPAVAAGFGLAAVGAVLLAQVPASGNALTAVLPGFLISGLGLGATFVTATTTAMAHVGPHDAGTTSGLVNTGHELGATLGIAFVSTLAAQSLQGGGDTVSGFGAAFTATAIAAAVAAVGATLLVPAGRPPATDGPVFAH